MRGHHARSLNRVCWALAPAQREATGGAPVEIGGGAAVDGYFEALANKRAEEEAANPPPPPSDGARPDDIRYRSSSGNRGGDYMLSLKIDSQERKLAFDDANGVMNGADRARLLQVRALCFPRLSSGRCHDSSGKSA